MADEQYRWLDRRTAEILLSGQSLEAVDAAAREQAERLAATLGALSAQPAPDSAELPGEAAALAAFRTARAGAAAPGERDAASSDAGLVRLGAAADRPRRPRWGRPLRLGLSAALAAGMVGSVAVAATTGVLPTPFGGGRPDPAASVSAAVNSGRPLVSPSPRAPQDDPSADGTTEPTGPQGTPRGGATSEPGTAAGPAGQGTWSGAPAACRDVRAGKELGTERRHALEAAAGGSGAGRVWKYCKTVLGPAGNGTAGADQDGRGKGKGNAKGGGKGNGTGGQGGPGGQGEGDQNGRGDQGESGGDGEGSHITPGGGDGDQTAEDTAAPSSLLHRQTPSPSPTYSAL
ncbi:hypothetical protein ACYF6T_05835 [Streptomyces sp. 7R007]